MVLRQHLVAVADGARRRLRVELIRVIEHCGLGGARRGPVVVRRDGVQKLCEDCRVEIASAFLDQPQPKVDVPEQAALLGGAKCGAAAQLTDATDIVQERRA